MTQLEKFTKIVEKNNCSLKFLKLNSFGFNQYLLETEDLLRH